jgi:hypothetical protein
VLAPLGAHQPEHHIVARNAEQKVHGSRAHALYAFTNYGLFHGMG